MYYFTLKSFYKVIGMKKFLIIILTLFCIQTYSQSLTDLVMKFDLKEDMVKRDELLKRRIKNNHFFDTEGELKCVHVYQFEVTDPIVLPTRQNWLDGSILDYIKPKYIHVREKRFGRKKRYLDGYTFIVRKDGTWIANYRGYELYLHNFGRMPQALLNNDVFMFNASWDQQFQRSKTGTCIIVGEDKLYFWDDDWNELGYLDDGNSDKHDLKISSIEDYIFDE